MSHPYLTKERNQVCLINDQLVLTVNLCKVFESILRDNMIEHLKDIVLLKVLSYGFVRNKSCLTNLLVFMEEVTN